MKRKLITETVLFNHCFCLIFYIDISFYLYYYYNYYYYYYYYYYKDCHHILFLHVPAGLDVVPSLVAAVELGPLVDGAPDGFPVFCVVAPSDGTKKY